MSTIPIKQCRTKQQARREALRAALIAGEQSGPSESFDFDRFLEQKHADRL